MPTNPTYPGIYIEEMPSGARTIVGVSTSITAFIGRAKRGPVNEPVLIENFGGFSRRFGGLWAKSTLGYAVQQYFTNGGSQALIVRVHKDANSPPLLLPKIALQDSGGENALELEAANPGEWGNYLRASVNYNNIDDSDTENFNLIIQEFDPNTEATIEEVDPNTEATIEEEIYLNVSMDANAPRYVSHVLGTSQLMKVSGVLKDNRLAETEKAESNMAGSDGEDIDSEQIIGGSLEENREGLWALEKADIFNMLVIPPFKRSDGDVTAVYSTAATYCEKRRAILIMDPPSSWTTSEEASKGDFDKSKNAALYWPRVRLPDPLRENRLETFAPSGIIAGIIARTDAQRGIWKAPAGTDASMLGVRELSYKMTDGENGRLNPLGINALRTFPVIGRVVWGARTTVGADQLASEWKYLPVRRLALYIEESLYRGTQWAVFEPNDAPLWAQLRKSITGFMQNIFRQGAFQGATPNEAYLVKCDAETTTQGDIDRGIVNIIVGFSPLKPAEFVIIKIQQLAREDS